MDGSYAIAVVGATGAVGEVLLELLTERSFPAREIHLLASARSVGETKRVCGKQCTVKLLDDFDFSQVDIAFFSAGGAVSEKFAPIAADAGALVIDNTSCFRYDPDVPLVVPEVNPEAIAEASARNIIANPNCSTIQMLVALKPIYDVAGIARINVATYQAVSGAGRQAISELADQSAQLMNGQSVEASVFPTQIAYNVIPQIDVFLENGYTKEEMKMVWETKKILHDDNVEVNPTAVRVPVFYGHAEAVHIETVQPITAEEVTALLEQAPGIVVYRGTAYPTPTKEAVGQDPVHVGRIREDISHPNGVNMWVVSDNLRKGAALNAIQIAEILHEYR